MRKLKIAAFVNITVEGGAKKAFCELVKKLSKKHEVDFYQIQTLEKNNYGLTDFVRNAYTFEYNWLYFKIRPFSYLNIFLAFLNLYKLDRAYLKMAQAIDKNNYDLVFIGQCFISFFAPSLLKYLKTTKIFYPQEPVRKFYEPQIDFQRNVTLRKKLSHLLLNPLYKLYDYNLKLNDRRNITYADWILCNSHYTKENIYKAYGLLAEVNYLGVDTEKFKPLDIPKDNLVISVGHLCPGKGHDFVIKSIAQISDLVKPKLAIVYPIVADGVAIEYKIYLQRLADENAVETLFFENITDVELVRLYNKAKVTACAYIREPFGLVPLESMACQTPVVAVREGGLKESVIDHHTGLFSERNIVDFAKTIEYLIKNEELRINMGIAARQHVLNNWTWDKAREELERNFYKVVIYEQ